MIEQSDAELVAAVLAGHAEAFGVLVRRYQNAYFRFAVRMVGNRDDADDALQSAFVRAHRALAGCRDPERFGGWLYQIVVNECRTLTQRRNQRERKMVRDPDAMGDIEAAPEGGEPGELDEIHMALQQLDADQREAFLLKHVEQLNYDEMAELTGASVSALKMRVKRARDRLQEILEPARSET